MREPQQNDGLMTRREFIKKVGLATLFATGASLLSPFFKSPPKVEGKAEVGALSRKANILETDNTLGVENAVAQFQVECKGVPLSTFVFTEQSGEYPNKWPRVFTNVNDETVELEMDGSDGKHVNWYIPGKDVPDREKGVSGAVGAEYILMHQNKYVGNKDNILRYWPPHDGKAESINFNEQEGAYEFSLLDLPKKVRELLFT